MIFDIARKAECPKCKGVAKFKSNISGDYGSYCGTNYECKKCSVIFTTYGMVLPEELNDDTIIIPDRWKFEDECVRDDEKD